MRLDLLLVEKKLAPSRAQAQALIKSGAVEVHAAGVWRVAERASQDVVPEIELRLKDDLKNPYVSRGGLKLEAALKHTGLSPNDLKVLDIGISTGGFTDCLLQRGAREVVGVDSGQGQLHPQLAGDSRLKALEKVNARELSKLALGGPFDLIVIDVSFISITLIVPELSAQLRPAGHVLALVKPQFEVGPKNLNKKGLVRDEEATIQAIEKVRQTFSEHNFKVKDVFPCAIKGGDGNQEYFLYAEKIDSRSLP